MRLFNRIADAIIRYAMKRPYIHLPGYMNRWWLVPYNQFGIAARVHQILRSDQDRHYHDHPWWYISIVLRGGYFEVTPCGECGISERKWRGPGSIAFRRASSWHRLELKDDGLLYCIDPEKTYGETVAMRIRQDPNACWTLFITGPASQQWGFLVDGKKVPASEYLGDRFIDTKYEGAAA